MMVANATTVNAQGPGRLVDEVELLERDVQLARLAELHEQVSHGRGALALIEGAPGVGKTALWRVACAQAQRAGATVLRGRCGEQERSAPFAPVRECFSEVLSGASDPLLAGASRHAAPALGLISAETVVSGMFAALHGLYWLLANLARRGPVVLGLDDIQWADEATARWLEYISPRLPELRVLFLLTSRAAELAAGDTVARALSASTEIERIRLTALSERAVADLLAHAFNERLDAGFTAECYRASGGNPLLLRALIADLRAVGTAPSMRSIEGVDRLGAEHVGGLVLPRIHRRGNSAVRVARAIAVLGEATELRDAAAVAQLKVSVASAACDQLVRDDVLRYDATLAFVHPLVRAAVYGELASGERSRLQRLAAVQLHLIGGRAEDVARHLLSVEPAADAWVFERLRAGAMSAAQAGAPEVAIAMLLRALREPPPPDALCDLFQEIASAGARIGHPDTARWAREAVAAADTPVQLGRATLRMGQVLRLLGDLSLAQSLSARTLAEIAAVDNDLAVHNEACALMSATHRPSGRASVVIRRQHWIANPPMGSGIGERAMRAYVAWEMLQQNRPAAKTLELFDSVLDGCDWLAMAGPESWAFWLVAVVGFGGRPAQWLAWADRAMDAARRAGSVVGFEVASYHRSLANLMLGKVIEAEADALGALEIGSQYSWGLVRSYRCAAAIRAFTERGDFDTAQSLTTQLGRELSGSELSLFDLPYLEFKGRLELARGRPREALASFLALRDALPTEWTSSSFVAWRPGAALAYHALGDTHVALALAEQELELADAFGAAHVRGIALRTRGLVRGGENGIADVQHALDLLQTAGAWLEHGWALHALGVLLRRHRRPFEAREPLRTAVDYAARSGAELLRQKSLDELRAAGAKPRRELRSGVDALTARELRVAQLAAQGFSNTEIAQLLFITYKTVDTHLGHVYQKLDITRPGLAAALAGTTVRTAGGVRQPTRRAASSVRASPPSPLTCSGAM
jgi:DNA-binding CsgD family transcriptional regulator